MKSIPYIAALLVGFAQPAFATDWKLLDEFKLPTGIRINGLEFGGISAIDYDPESGHFLALSDDRVEKGPARFYELNLDINGEGIQSVDIVAHTELTDLEGKPYVQRSVDPEGLVRAKNGQIYWSQERDLEGKPSVGIMDAKGRGVANFKLPDYYFPNTEGTQGARSNLALESLTVTKEGKVVVAMENALVQDGPAASVKDASPARVLVLDPETKAPVAEYVYMVNPAPSVPVKSDGFVTNGLTEMLAQEDGSFYALERSFAAGQGNHISLYQVSLDGATDVLGKVSLQGVEYTPVKKEPVLTLVSGGMVDQVDNIEAMSYGANVDGKPTLVLMSDNNFNREGQFTQILVFTKE